ncbi:hypothetical protein M0812_21004 [Anaeramoeba flamelloides]|uniref:Uncharacterized protein n=1 Tax=Anaeramoeba flamelloides TaxID=1746091 RepID=A0AAV7YRF2_9EUKA|nr:hypothetical protein M0812_21004 [Anaeramoeba flamelloides]|eukprot:Anaeramoba_flamelloidesa1081635_20.p1 GENE.a1081635_20~~a1081635_20.p1  ORF type:complete len:151 (-),score=37.51 a1081635_20:7-459(-)
MMSTNSLVSPKIQKINQTQNNSLQGNDILVVSRKRICNNFDLVQPTNQQKNQNKKTHENKKKQRTLHMRNLESDPITTTQESDSSDEVEFCYEIKSQGPILDLDGSMGKYSSIVICNEPEIELSQKNSDMLDFMTQLETVLDNYQEVSKK